MFHKLAIQHHKSNHSCDTGSCNNEDIDDNRNNHRREENVEKDLKPDLCLYCHHMREVCPLESG